MSREEYRCKFCVPRCGVESYPNFFTDSSSLYRQSFHTAPPDGTRNFGDVDLLTAKLCSRKRRDFSIIPGERALCTLNRTLGVTANSSEALVAELYGVIYQN